MKERKKNEKPRGRRPGRVQLGTEVPAILKTAIDVSAARNQQTIAEFLAEAFRVYCGWENPEVEKRRIEIRKIVFGMFPEKEFPFENTPTSLAV